MMIPENVKQENGKGRTNEREQQGQALIRD